MKTPESHVVIQLENMLHIWEDTLCIAEAMSSQDPKNKEAAPLTGSVVNWKHLRTELLKRKPLDQERFTTPPEVCQRQFMGSPIMKMLPFTLHNWSVTSRRVYDLSADFQRKLEFTSLGSVTWKDVTFPFPSFGINLPLPIKWQAEGVDAEIDFLLVEIMDNDIIVTSIGKNLHGRKLLTDKKRERIEHLLSRRHFDKLFKILLEFGPEHFAMPPSQILRMPITNDPVMEDVQDENFDMAVVGESVNRAHTGMPLPDYLKLTMRLIVGLCLHLEAATSHRRSKSRVRFRSWEKAQPVTHDPRAIVSESLVCYVETTGPISAEERAFHDLVRRVGIKLAQKEMPVHYRKHHWRKGPNMADDPLAPKWVEVDWAWVRKDRLPESGLAAGSQIPTS